MISFLPTPCRPSARCSGLAHRLAAVALMAWLAFAAPAHAGPGAHGPNGEHLDAPASTAPTGPALPRAESFSDLFELVARLQPEALVIDLVRYTTNEPVAAATVEVESGSAKALAAFDAVTGTYRVTEADFLQAIAAPGTHALVFMLKAGPDADLLEATLTVASPQATQADAHTSHWPATLWPVIAAAVFVVAVVVLGWRRQSRRRGAFA